MALSTMKKTKSDDKKEAPKILPSKYNRGWSTTDYGWMPSPSDIKLRAMAEPIVAQKMEYVSSPTYKERLLKSGEKKADELVKQRLERLKNIQYFVGPKGASSTIGIPGTPNTSMQIAYGSPQRETIAHEMGHVTSNTGSSIASSATEGQPGSMSPVEGWKFINYDKTLTPSQKQNAYKWYNNAATKLGQYQIDPTRYTMSGDEHLFGAGEAKADLDALRQLLIDNKIVKKFGENITPDVMKKAAENKNIKNSLFYKRLQDRYGDEGTIKLNNEVAILNPKENLNQA